MVTVQLLSTRPDGGQDVLLTLDNGGVDGSIRTHGNPTLAADVLTDRPLVKGKRVTTDTPEAWLRALPYQYFGSYLRAVVVLPKPVRAVLVESEWDEEKHPRADDGKFSSGGGGGGGASDSGASAGAKDRGGGTSTATLTKIDRSGLRPAEFDALLARVAEPDSGFTYNPFSHHAVNIGDEGYAVAMYPGREQVIPVSKLKAEDLLDYALRNGDLLREDQRAYLGVWHDPVTNNAFLDISGVMKDRNEAFGMGREHHQLAVFNFKTGQSENVPAQKAWFKNVPKDKGANDAKREAVHDDAQPARLDPRRDRARLQARNGGPGTDPGRSRIDTSQTGTGQARRTPLVRAELVPLREEWSEDLHPRDDIGRFTSGGGGDGGGEGYVSDRNGSGPARSIRPRVSRASTPALPKDATFTDEQVRVELEKKFSARSVRIATTKKNFTGEPKRHGVTLTKNETQAVSERLAIEYLRSQGFKDARPIKPSGRNNYPVDIVYDSRVVEVKGGDIAASKKAQQWRLTQGEPNRREKEAFKHVAAEDRRRYGGLKQDRIFARKQLAQQQIERVLGRKVTFETITMVVDAKSLSSGVADIYKFEGLHKRIGWNSPEAQTGYKKSLVYKGF